MKGRRGTGKHLFSQTEGRREFRDGRIVERFSKGEEAPAKKKERSDEKKLQCHVISTDEGMVLMWFLK